MKLRLCLLSLLPLAAWAVLSEDEYEDPDFELDITQYEPDKPDGDIMFATEAELDEWMMDDPEYEYEDVLLDEYELELDHGNYYRNNGNYRRGRGRGRRYGTYYNRNGRKYRYNRCSGRGCYYQGSYWRGQRGRYNGNRGYYLYGRRGSPYRKNQRGRGRYYRRYKRGCRDEQDGGCY